MSEVEEKRPRLQENLQTVVEASKHYVAGSVASEGLNRAVRDAHATGFGLARGEVSPALVWKALLTHPEYQTY